jgi:amino acid transporter
MAKVCKIFVSKELQLSIAVEFILSTIKIMGCAGFIILAIIIDCGGVGNQGYLGAKYWHNPGAFNNGFKGFCSVFVVAAFAFGGTELVGLAAAEAANPRKSLPQATKQVFWRISFFYILSLFLLGLIVPSDNPNLLNSSGANSKFSPFVIAIRLAGIKALPSIFNVIITISVISVANSCTFGSTRTMQALAERGMGPAFLAHVDKHGRPIWGVAIQLLFGLLAFIGEAKNATTVFNWLLSLSGLSYFFVWGCICLAHIRFRSAWKAQGHVKAELPYEAIFGVGGSWYGFLLNILCMIATFYTALYVSSNPLSQYIFSANTTATSPSVEAQTLKHSSKPTSQVRSSSPSSSDGSCTPECGPGTSLHTRWTSRPAAAPSNLTPMTCRQRRRGRTCQCARRARCSKTSHATASSVS